MLKKTILSTFFCALSITISFAQINFSANDQVPEFTGKYRFGVNLGYHGSQWSDQDLANISAGNASSPLMGAGVETHRPPLYEWFMLQYGYDQEVQDFQHYASLGMEDLTVFVGYPSDDHQDSTFYCDSLQSQVFDNLYLDIWDGGLNGTPVNDENYYALYMYNLVTTYGPYVKFWEIWNEPDFDASGNAWKSPDIPGNWYDNVPEPCDLALKAPVYNYIRMLRISYEVIKSIEPDDYITLGGIGYTSFLDVVLRHTDNPNNGEVSAEYPLKGGAYFDVVSYHSYPHIDGSLRYWDNDLDEFVFSRHSDKAKDGVLEKQAEFQAILNNYNYNGETYPLKKWIITESNIPRVSFDENIGSDEAQRNFLIKTRVACQQNEILQFHLFALAEKTLSQDFEDAYDAMGLYQNLTSIDPFNEIKTEAGIASTTMTQLLDGAVYDPVKTDQLNLPDHIKGGAFKHNDDLYTYILWAETLYDFSEEGNAEYTFPFDFNITNLERREWDYSETLESSSISIVNVKLLGQPLFFTTTENPTSTTDVSDLLNTINVFPNPSNGLVNIDFGQSISKDYTLEVLNTIGKVVYSETLRKQNNQLDLKTLVNGNYLFKFSSDENIFYKKLVIVN